MVPLIVLDLAVSVLLKELSDLGDVPVQLLVVDLPLSVFNRSLAALQEFFDFLSCSSLDFILSRLESIRDLLLDVCLLLFIH